MPILSNADYPTVRAALDITLDAIMLPDAIIGQSIFQGRAEAEVTRRDPNAPNESGVNLTHIKNACIYLTASLLAPSIPDIVRETLGPSQTYERKSMDWATRAAELRGQAENEISLVLTGGLDLTVTRTPAMVSGSPGACGGRGG